MVNSTEDPEHKLFHAIAQLKSADEAEQFFFDLCTPAEISAMADRWRVVHPIKLGTPYRKIYEQTGVSSTTVGRVAREIKYGSGGYDLIYERVTRQANERQRKTQNRTPKRRATK